MEPSSRLRSDFFKSITIATGLFLVYNSNCRAIGSRDTHINEYVALSLGTYYDATLDEFPFFHETGLRRGYLQQRAGHVYSSYPIAPALMAAPAYWLATKVGFLDSAQPILRRVEAVGKIVASAATALACAVLFLVVRKMLPDVPAGFVALAAGLATPLWSAASQALWTHAPGALFLALGLACLKRVDSSSAFAAGIALAAAATCRPLLSLFLFGSAIGLIHWTKSRLQLTSFLAGAALVLAVAAFYNASTFGTIWGGFSQLHSAGLHQQEHAVQTGPFGNFLGGLSGILFSPSRGLLIFTPAIILIVPGVIRAWRADPLARWVVVIPTVGAMLAWANYSVWWGGHSYGPRFAADLAVPTAILAAISFDPVPTIYRSPVLRGLPCVFLAWSIGVQALGAFFYPNGHWNSMPVDVDRAHHRLWDWRDSQIVRTLKAGPYTKHLEALMSKIE